jgi:hypothetical protein
MIFTTPEQALTYVSKNLQGITETLFPPQEEACKYIAAWIVSKQGERDIQTIRNVLKWFSREMDSGSEFVMLQDVLESDAFDLGEFYDDDEESDRYGLIFQQNCERLGLYLD